MKVIYVYDIRGVLNVYVDNVDLYVDLIVCCWKWYMYFELNFVF